MALDQKERDLFTRGIDVMKTQVRDASDMDYYFRIYGKIENYLFPEIRGILLAKVGSYTDYQLQFLKEYLTFLTAKRKKRQKIKRSNSLKNSF